jgi:hypothetical protein
MARDLEKIDSSPVSDAGFTAEKVKSGRSETDLSSEKGKDTVEESAEEVFIEHVES